MKQLQEIMDLIGKKRFIGLVVLLVITGAMGFLWQQMLLPQSEEIEREKKTIESDRSRLQTELVQLPIRYAELKANEAKYEELIQSSFVSSQDRISARTRIEGIRANSLVRGLNYTISPQEKVTHPNEQRIEGTLVRSTINVTLQGLSDMEMRDFIENMQEDFGGLVLLRSVEYKLDKPFSSENLKTLSDNKVLNFVTGKIVLHWYTIVPPQVDPNASAAQAGGM